MKAKSVLAIFLVFSLVIPAAVSAKELISYLPRLMNEHQLVRAAEALRNEARYREDSAKGGWYPSLDLRADGGREWVERVDQTESDELSNYETVRLTQLVTDFGATSSQVKMAGAMLSRSREELKTTQQTVLLQGITAYIEIFKAREKLRYALESEENISRQTGMEEVLVERGAGLSSDILQTKSQLARAQALRVSIEGELALAKNRFRAVYGFVPTDQEIKEFRLPAEPAQVQPVTLESALSRAFENNPTIFAAQHNSAIVEQEIGVRKAQYFPRLNLYVEGIRREDDLGVEGTRLDSFVGAELTYNLFRGGADSSAVKAATEKHAAAQGTLEDTRMLVEENVRNAWQNLMTSREKYRYLKNQAVIVEKFLELARKERKLGSRSLLDVLTGEVEYINAQSQAVAAEVEIVLASFQLYYAMGDLVMDLVKTQ